MDIKEINMERNPLSDKIITYGDHAFKLWLEFEETSPWEDISNDFANIGVDTLDGRSYGINTWTFKFLNTAIQRQIKEDDKGKDLFCIPPDLFVKELSRECLEETIGELLDQGNLEEVLNPSVFFLQFMDPWSEYYEMPQSGNVIEEELRASINSQHPLYGVDFDVEAYTENHEVVVKLEDNRYATIQLNASNNQTSTPVVFYNDAKDFWEKRLRNDIILRKS